MDAEDAVRTAAAETKSPAAKNNAAETSVGKTSDTEERLLQQPKDMEIDAPSLDSSQDDFEVVPSPIASVSPSKSTPSGRKGKAKNAIIISPAMKAMWRKPFEMGWGREIVFRNTSVDGKRTGDVYYFSPEGKKFRSTKEIEKHLLETMTDGSISLECFTFRKEPVFKEPFEIIRNAKNVTDKKSKNSMSQLLEMSSPEEGKKKKTSVPKKKKERLSLPLPLPHTPEIQGIKKKKVGPQSAERKMAKAVKPKESTGPVPVSLVKAIAPKPPSAVAKPGVAKKHTGKRKPTTVLVNGTGKKTIVEVNGSASSKGKGQRLCDLECGSSAPSLHCEVCMCLFHPHCVKFTPTPGAKFICQSCSGEEALKGTPTAIPSSQPVPVSKPAGAVSILPAGFSTATTRVLVAPTSNAGTTVQFSPSISATVVPPAMVNIVRNRSIAPGTLIGTSTTKVSSPSPAPPIRLNIPTGAVNPDQVSGQLITLPPHVTSKLNLQKPLNLKLNGQTFNIPPKCFIATNDGVKVLLPPGSLPENISKGGPANPIAMKTSKEKGIQQLEANPMTDTVDKETKPSSSSPSNIVDLTEENAVAREIEKAVNEKKQKNRDTKIKDTSKVLCHFRKLHSGFDCMVHIFQYLTTADLLRVQQVCKTWYNVASQSCVWKNVRLRNIIVTNWEAAASHIEHCRSHTLDLRMMIHPNGDANKTWHHFHAILGQLKCVRQIEFTQCPSSILHAVTEKLSNLKHCSAEFIVENTQDPLSSNAKLDLGKFSHLKKLECLKLKGVKGLVLPAFSFSGGVVELGSLTALKTLVLTTLRDLPAEEYKFLGSLVNLEVLEIGDLLTWTDETYEQLGKLSKLKNLRLENGGTINNESLGIALEDLKQLKQLEMINMVISEKVANSLSMCTSIESFSVWPNKDEEPAKINSNLLKAISTMTSLKLLEWGVMNECSSEGDSFIPLLPQSTAESEDGENVELIPQEVSINELMKRLSNHLPDTKIRVFKVPAALIKKACPPRPSPATTPQLVADEQQQQPEQNAAAENNATESAAVADGEN